MGEVGGRCISLEVRGAVEGVYISRLLFDVLGDWVLWLSQAEKVI